MVNLAPPVITGSTTPISRVKTPGKAIYSRGPITPLITIGSGPPLCIYICMYVYIYIFVYCVHPCEDDGPLWSIFFRVLPLEVGNVNHIKRPLKIKNLGVVSCSCLRILNQIGKTNTCQNQIAIPGNGYVNQPLLYWCVILSDVF